MIETLYLECSCHSDEHTLIFRASKTFTDQYQVTYEPEFWTSVFLHQYRSIFKRIWVAIKYVFGYKCKYGHWDVFILKAENIDQLIRMLQEHKNELKTYENLCKEK